MCVRGTVGSFDPSHSTSLRPKIASYIHDWQGLFILSNFRLHSFPKPTWISCQSKSSCDLGQKTQHDKNCT